MLTSVNKINVGLTPNDRQTFIQHVIGRLQTSRPTIYIYINLNRYVQCLILIEVNGIDSDEINAGVKLLKMFVFDTLRNAWRTDDAAFADAIESTSSCKETSRICNND